MLDIINKEKEKSLNDFIIKEKENNKFSYQQPFQKSKKISNKELNENLDNENYSFSEENNRELDKSEKGFLDFIKIMKEFMFSFLGYDLLKDQDNEKQNVLENDEIRKEKEIEDEKIEFEEFKR